ncbi:ArsR/SmtB family transcription factor [Labrys wisconsinensis]|uniref:DNA-binding transcriptional ArsR family regulator n=1 Tax=Labrys wisconsinensis TaxID=425677 RepID=A0ABU0IZD7_9HYPH|nr:helix-turn-helix transcriptional regulator [Labrys wisconsinensis]MDQ0467373.1 DNA-binding transcriptional ArsR family regulator [Labrys wisconsinensis]
MQTGPKIAEVAALVGDPARANMLGALMDGRALTASELAYAAHVTPQTASAHLGKLVDGGILALARQGRHRYFRLASPLVGRMLEGIMAVAQAGPARYHPHWRGGEDLRFARLCYDHLAGELAVRIADVLAEREQIVLGEDGGEVTPAGRALLDGLGIDVAGLTRQRRVFCRPCLDWSMRRPHIAGAVGAAMLERFLVLGWLRRSRDSRVLAVTPVGHRHLQEAFGIAPVPAGGPEPG